MEFRKIHFVGIGGIGMSGIARILIEKGYQVSGSDIADTAMVKELRSLGAKIKVGHAAANLNGSEVAVVSSAISISNPEVKCAIRRGVPILHRSEMLAHLMNEKKGIAIAGTHGKTTTTSMVSLLLERADLDPTLVIGGVVDQFKSNAKTGRGEYLVAEADESDGSLVRLNPYISVVTNIEADHMDYYTDVNDIRKTFAKFLQKTHPDGLAVLCTDDHNVKQVSEQYHGRKRTYGLVNGAELKAFDVKFSELGSDFLVVNRGLELGRFQLRVPGMHNVYNALAAIAIGLELNIDSATIQAAFNEFKGAKRRFQIISSSESMTVVDDYAHHPTEIMATLSAARKVRGNGRIISVFQPHRYTRTKYFYDLYGRSFFNSDHVIVTDVYAAGEKPLPRVNGELIAESLRKYGHPEVKYIPDISDVPAYIGHIARENDFVITLGAGDVWKVAQAVSSRVMSA
jgi:UDP-N-acetylmuramate--alanine ligase